MMNASPAHWLDDLIESYWEVVGNHASNLAVACEFGTFSDRLLVMTEVPYGEGLVGKKFPWSFEASCRTEGGERWCKPPRKTIRPHWTVRARMKIITNGLSIYF